MSDCTNGAVLVARRDSEYYFVDSVFDHGDNAGCTGCVVYPVTGKMVDELLSIENLEERYGDYWEERYEGEVDENCEACDGHIDDDGCEACGYPSLRSLCQDIAQYDGSDAVIDNPGYEYAEAINAVCDDEIEYADCTGCGRIFSSFDSDKPMTPDDFDEVYNLKALVAALAYEASAVDYDYAIRVIFGK